MMTEKICIEEVLLKHYKAWSFQVLQPQLTKHSFHTFYVHPKNVTHTRELLKNYKVRIIGEKFDF